MLKPPKIYLHRKNPNGIPGKRKYLSLDNELEAGTLNFEWPLMPYYRTIIKKYFYREKSRYDDKGGHHPDYYDRRVGREQTEGISNYSINNSRSDDNRGGCYPASDNMYYGEEKRDRGSSAYSSTNDQRNSGSYKQRDREYYRR